MTRKQTFETVKTSRPVAARALWRQLTRGLRSLFNRAAADRDIADEVEHYFDETVATLEARGLSPEDARRTARRELGQATAIREQVRSYGWENVVDTLGADLRYGARRLRRSPSFACVGALTLALGIGASTAIFSAVNPVLLQPLPYPDADRLMVIWDRQRGETADVTLDVTFGTYRELVERSRSFESLAVMRPFQPTLTGVEEPERLDGQSVSAAYFRVLGVRPALGRDFQPSDDLPGASPAVIISDGLWRRRFAADRTIAGRPIALDGVPVTVIGVLPPGFDNVMSPSAEVWSALRYDPSLPLNGREWGHHLRLVGRLADGRRAEDGRRELDEIAATPRAEFPRPSWASLDAGFIVRTLHDDLTRGVRPVLLAVLGATALLLVIACVNVTNLLLARGAGRRTELAVRAALGASRWRLVRQLLTETLLLGGLGGVAGFTLAHLAVGLVSRVGASGLPRAGMIDVDTWALAFAAALTMLVGLAIGIVPALHGFGADLHGGMQQRSSRISSGRRSRRTLVVVQTALALVLLVGAGLLFRTLQQLLDVPPGFTATRLLTMQVQTAGPRFSDPAAAHRFFEQALEAVREIPGVSAAAFTSQLPLTGDEDVWGIHFASVPSAAAEETRDGYRYAVSPGYFEAMGIPLRQGRLLNAQDTANAPPAVVINESFAKRRLPGLNPVGQRLHIGPDSGPWFTVVGVVADVKQMSLAMTRSDAVYVTAAQWRFSDNARWLVVRTQGDAAALTPAVRTAIWSIDRDQPIVRVATMDERLAASMAEQRFALTIFQAFGVVALILAAVGTYSLLSSDVSDRVREIGVRVALGASRRRILTLVLRQGLWLAGLGLAAGLTGAGMASRALETLLFGVSRLDVATYLAVVILLGSVSAIACALPAWRATRVAPSVALRAE